MEARDLQAVFGEAKVEPLQHVIAQLLSSLLQIRATHEPYCSLLNGHGNKNDWQNYTYTYICVHIYMHIYICICICMYIYICQYIRIHTCTHCPNRPPILKVAYKHTKS